MKKIYIAGPFRGPDAWAITLNIHNAKLMIPIIGKAGHVPVCPHSMYGDFDGTLPDVYWLEATMNLLEVCDAVYLCENWRQSEGSKAEAARAEELGIPVFELLDDLLNWMSHQKSLEQEPR